MALSRSQSRVPSSADSLATALSEFQAGLTAEQQTALVALKGVPDPSAVISFTAQVDQKNAERRSRCVASRLCGVLSSVQQYSAILDTYSQSHADIAALVWGSIKFTILIASNFATFFDKLSERLMRLSTCCPRYSEYQALFSQFPRLQKALDAFYANVVRFCAKAIQVVERTGLAQYAQSLWKSFESEFGDIEKELKRQNEEVAEETRLASEQAASQARQLQAIERREAGNYRKDGRLFRKRVDQNAEETQRWRIQVDQRESRTRKQSLLDQLSTYNHLAALKENHRKRHGTTSTWLSKRAEYLKWLEAQDSCVFWLSGILGSGKTVLTAAVIDDLYCRQQFPRNSLISFFFCKDNDVESLQARTILCSLIRQCLTVDDLRKEVEVELEKLSAAISSDTEALYPLFKLISDRSRMHFIVIDGFDECLKADRDAVLAVLRQVMASSQSSIKIFLASREDIGKEIPRFFPSCCQHQTMVRQAVDEDIATYVEGVLEKKIEQGDLVVGDPDLIFSIRDALVSGSRGMFLWAAFQIEEICAQTCDEDIRKAMRDLPRDLTETYERALHRVSERGKAQIAEKIYLWVATVRRPLRLEELREAISVEPCQDVFKSDRLVNNMERMIPWCGNLVTLDEEDQLVQFAHHTVKQLLISKCSDPSTERFHFQPSEADLQVGEVCVTYLNFNDFKRQLIKLPKAQAPIDPQALVTTSISANYSPTISKIFTKITRAWKIPPAGDIDVLRQLSSKSGSSNVDPFQALQKQYSFLRYTCEFWLSHTSSLSGSTKTWSLFQKLVLAEDTFASKPWAADELVNGKQEMIRYTVDHAHIALLRFLLASHKGFEMSLSHEQHLLSYASQKGSLQVVEAVLSSIEFLKSDLNESLQMAAASGHLHVVEKLLTAEAEVNPEPTTWHGFKALQSAAGGGHLQVVERLLTAGAQVNAEPSGDGRTALQAAAEGGHWEVVDRLLAAGAEVNKPAKYSGRTALQAAAGGGYLELVERLLAVGADENAEPAREHGRTALQAAAQGGHLNVVDRLLAVGAEVNGEPAKWYGRTALQAAAEGGHLNVVDRLLAAGAEVNKPALQAAAQGGHLNVVDRLLAAGAEVNAEPAESDGRTALQAAAEGGHLDVVDRLLAAGAKVNGERAAYSGHTALQAAAQEGHLNVVDRLLAAGAEVNAQPADNHGRTTLQAAADGGHMEVVERLLAAGADVNASPAHKDGRTALQAAAEGGHLNVVDRLLAAGAEVNAEPAKWYGRTALQAAAEGGHLNVVDRLLAAGAKVDAKPAVFGGRTAMQAARKGGHLQVVERLKQAGGKEVI